MFAGVIPEVTPFTTTCAPSGAELKVMACRFPSMIEAHPEITRERNRTDKQPDRTQE
jgi:hypothetical protein